MWRGEILFLTVRCGWRGIPIWRAGKSDPPVCIWEKMVFTGIWLDSKVAWMPDTFAILARCRIMKGCRVDYFATQNCFAQILRVNPSLQSVLVGGIDGSKVLAHLFKENNAVFSPPGWCSGGRRTGIKKREFPGCLFRLANGDGAAVRPR